jgi:hypothetical protein
MKPKFKLGQKVKIVDGAPLLEGRFSTRHVGSTGTIISINDFGWGNKKLGKYAYKVLPENSIMQAPYFYPTSALQLIEEE